MYSEVSFRKFDKGTTLLMFTCRRDQYKLTLKKVVLPGIIYTSTHVHWGHGEE